MDSVLEKKMDETTLVTMAVPYLITEGRVWNLLVSAFEGGSNYWYCVDNTKLITPGGEIDVSKKSLRKLVGELSHTHVEYLHQIPLIPGYGLVMLDASDDGPGERTKYPLTRERLLAGLELMVLHHPTHFTNFLTQNDDAETADVFLQLCVLGELTYG